MLPNNSNKHVPSLGMCYWITLVSNGFNLHGTLLHSWISIGLVIVDYAKPNTCNDYIVNSLLWGSFWSWMLPFNNSNPVWKTWKSNQLSNWTFVTCPSINFTNNSFLSQVQMSKHVNRLGDLNLVFPPLVDYDPWSFETSSIYSSRATQLENPLHKKWSRVGIQTRRWGIYLFLCFPKANALDFTCATMLITRTSNCANLASMVLN
jgi:hypothetical protein